MFSNRWSSRTGSCSTSSPGLLNSAVAGRSVQGSVAARAIHPAGYDTENPLIVEVNLWVSVGAGVAEVDGLAVVGAGVGDGAADEAPPTPPGADGRSIWIPTTRATTTAAVPRPIAANLFMGSGILHGPMTTRCRVDSVRWRTA